jgi:hypothetical protein
MNNLIWNPSNQEFVDVSTTTGQQVLRKYVKYYMQMGGSEEDAGDGTVAGVEYPERTKEAQCDNLYKNGGCDDIIYMEDCKTHSEYDNCKTKREADKARGGKPKGHKEICEDLFTNRGCDDIIFQKSCLENSATWKQKCGEKKAAATIQAAFRKRQGAATTTASSTNQIASGTFTCTGTKESPECDVVLNESS